MLVLKTISEVHAACREFRRQGKAIGLIPTMGALHAGHLSLVRAARASCDVVVVSIFVNPTQFGPNEDFASYPHNLDRDCTLLEVELVDMVFAPQTSEMYPNGASTFVNVEGLSERLDGTSRPGHFRGVTTVVSKLLHIVQPHRAFFGQKDAAQVAVLSKMVRDLNLDVELVICPIVREPDGLALSSRNVYLDPKHRAQALVLSRAIGRMQELVDAGERSTARLLQEGRSVLASQPEVRIDYLAAVNPETLEHVSDLRLGALLAVAAYVGPTRLIDNLLLPPQ